MKTIEEKYRELQTEHYRLYQKYEKRGDKLKELRKEVIDLKAWVKRLERKFYKYGKPKNLKP